MELYTLGRDYIKKDVIDQFHSVIWTERYYGDSDVTITVPISSEMIQKLPYGVFLSLEGSKELMILETRNTKDTDGKITLTGISLLKWLNNRFIRTSAAHQDRYWNAEASTPGLLLWDMVYYMCVATSPYLDGTTPIGITNPERFAIPGLGLRDYDTSGGPVKAAIPFGPLYDKLREFATTFEIGVKIEFDPDDLYPLGFRSYKGVDRTSVQSEYPPVRFSPQMDSFTNIEELESIAALKTLAFSFAPGLNPDEGDPDLRTVPGVSSLSGYEYTGFDLRASQTFEEDITTDQVGGDPDVLVDILNSRAEKELIANQFVHMVDGEIVPDNQFKYGVHYNLGDIVEVEGKTGTVKMARVTEYIRAKDSSGEKAYPTVSVIE
jgi:hypothetical protein